MVSGRLPWSVPTSQRHECPECIMRADRSAVTDQKLPSGGADRLGMTVFCQRDISCSADLVIHIPEGLAVPHKINTAHDLTL